LKVLRLLLALGCAVPWFASARARAADPSDFYGRIISTVRFAGETPQTPSSRFEEVVRTVPGEPLRPVDVADSLRGLATGDELGELEVRAEPDGDRVAVVYFLRSRPRVEAFFFTGPGKNEAEKESGHLGLVEGEIYRSEKIDAAAARLKGALADAGWSRPRVSWKASEMPGSLERIDFEVETGPRAKLRSIRIDGAPPEIPPAQLAAKTRLEIGEDFRPGNATEAASRVRHSLLKQRFYGARVSAGTTGSPVSIDDDGSVHLVLNVTAGPRYELQREHVPPKLFSRQQLVPMLEDGAPDAGLWDAIEKKIEDQLQREGHPDAKSRVSVTRTPGSSPVLVLSATPGFPGKIVEMEFPGRKSIAEIELRASMATTVQRFHFGGEWIASDLRRDLRAITAIYITRGFVHVKVGPEKKEWIEPGKIRLVIPIEEGPETRVSSVAIEGVSNEDSRIILEKLDLKPSKVYDPTSIPDDLFRVKSFYADQGYLGVHATHLAPVFSEDLKTAALAFRVWPGSKTFVDRILIRGNSFTKASVIKRQIKVKPGDPLSLRLLLDSQQELARTGLFSHVEVTPTGPEGRSRRDVLVTIEEARHISLTYGVGYEYDTSDNGTGSNPRASFSISHNNLFGTGRLVGFEMRASTRDNRLLATYREPNPFGLNLPVTLSVLYAKEYRPSIPDLTLRRHGLFIDTARTFAGEWKAQLRYEYQIVRPKCGAGSTDCPVALGTLDRLDQSNAIAALSPGLLVDRRDDPFDPKTGTLLGVEVKYAFPLFDANAKFLKAYTQAAAYRTFGPFTLAGSIRGGIIQPLRDSADPEFPNKEIPIVERFFAGGRSTHRAFSLDKLGIEGQTILPSEDDPTAKIPIGGDALLLGSAEARFPISSGFQGALFFDIGNVWSEPSKIRTADLRSGAGFGLRYLTPVGPIRVDYGWKLGRKHGESIGEFSFSIGYPY